MTQTARGWVVRECIALLAVLAVFQARSTAAVRLPLEGYCRPGRYFPIEISQTGPTHFTAAGALDTDVQGNSQLPRIVPMLVIGTPSELRWPGGSLPLRSPGDRERLVASVSDTAAATVLFPGDRIVPIRLNPADPLPGPPVAWVTLDAVVLDAGVMTRITTGQRSALLAAGVILAVPSKDKPDDPWPWRQRGPMWVLSYSPLGPVDQLVNEQAYAPTFAWRPGWSPAVRAQVAAAAVIFFLAVTALAMIRTRRAFMGVVVLSLGSAGAVALWQRSLGSVNRAGGDVFVQSGGLLQKDTWVFERARQTGNQIVPWAGWTVPIFAADGSVDSTAMSIDIAADKFARFHFKLDAGKSMAFVRREVQPGSTPATIVGRKSPMRDSAKAIYLEKGDRIVGETAGNADRWPGVVVGRNVE